MKYNETIKRIAVRAIDIGSGRFCDILSRESQQSVLSRPIFTKLSEEFPDSDLNELPGWAEFKTNMRDLGFGNILEDIERIDNETAIEILEKELLESHTRGDKEGVYLCVKALSGMVNKRKLTNDAPAIPENSKDSFEDFVIIEIPDEV